MFVYRLSKKKYKLDVVRPKVNLRSNVNVKLINNVSVHTIFF